MHERFFFITSILAILTTTACAPVADKMAKTPTAINPKSRPVINVTSFSPCMECMDALLEAKLDRNVLLIAEDIPNKSGTAGVAESGKEMLISAISSMAAESGRIRFVSHDKDLAIINQLFSIYQRQEGNKKEYQLPEYFIRGAISQVEKNAAQAERDITLDIARYLGLGQDEASAMSVIALDMNVGEVGTMQIVPGVTSHNVLAIFRNSKSNDLIAGYYRYGSLGYFINLQESEGMSAALRSLIELGAIELVGKLLDLPYEKCLSPETRPGIMAEAKRMRKSSSPPSVGEAHKSVTERPAKTKQAQPSRPAAVKEVSPSEEPPRTVGAKESAPSQRQAVSPPKPQRVNTSASSVARKDSFEIVVDSSVHEDLGEAASGYGAEDEYESVLND